MVIQVIVCDRLHILKREHERVFHSSVAGVATAEPTVTVVTIPTRLPIICDIVVQANQQANSSHKSLTQQSIDSSIG